MELHNAFALYENQCTLLICVCTYFMRSVHILSGNLYALVIFNLTLGL